MSRLVLQLLGSSGTTMANLPYFFMVHGSRSEFDVGFSSMLKVDDNNFLLTKTTASTYVTSGPGAGSARANRIFRLTPTADGHPALTEAGIVNGKSNCVFMPNSSFTQNVRTGNWVCMETNGSTGQSGREETLWLKFDSDTAYIEEAKIQGSSTQAMPGQNYASNHAKSHSRHGFMLLHNQFAASGGTYPYSGLFEMYNSNGTLKWRKGLSKDGFIFAVLAIRSFDILEDGAMWINGNDYNACTTASGNLSWKKAFSDISEPLLGRLEKVSSYYYTRDQVNKFVRIANPTSSSVTFDHLQMNTSGTTNGNPFGHADIDDNQTKLNVGQGEYYYRNMTMKNANDDIWLAYGNALALYRPSTNKFIGRYVLKLDSNGTVKSRIHSMEATATGVMVIGTVYDDDSSNAGEMGFIMHLKNDGSSTMSAKDFACFDTNDLTDNVTDVTLAITWTTLDLTVTWTSSTGSNVTSLGTTFSTSADMKTGMSGDGVSNQTDALFGSNTKTM
tara:strand:+ start:369 stop:1874 length:1506 start_codon:yes stop_codon:yes gene_type:complete